jgi:hypothetical protein
MTRIIQYTERLEEAGGLLQKVTPTYACAQYELIEVVVWPRPAAAFFQNGVRGWARL